MKAMLSLFLILFFAAISAASASDSRADEKMDYCYKPSKPLFFATAEYKRHYAEDVKEYQRCRQGFIEMQARVATMKEESEKNAKNMQDNFIIRHY